MVVTSDWAGGVGGGCSAGWGCSGGKGNRECIFSSGVNCL